MPKSKSKPKTVEGELIDPKAEMRARNQARYKKKREAQALESKSRALEPKWRDEFIQQCEDYASLGANYSDMANMLGVTPKTFIEWRKARPELEQAILRGRGLQQCNVSRALLHRALGKTKIHEEKVETATINGKKVVKTTRTVKELAPDVAAQKAWLEAHDPEKWGGSAKMNAAERAAQIAADNDANRPTLETIVGAVKQLMQGGG